MRRTLTRISLAVLTPHRVRGLRAARAREVWAAQQWQDYRDRHLAALLAHVGARVPFYRDRIPGGGPVRPADAMAVLATLPLVSKVMLTQQPELFRAPSTNPRNVHGTTGGSTGTILAFTIDANSRHLRLAVDSRARLWAGWRWGEPAAMLWGHHRDLTAARALAERARNALLYRTLMLDATDLGERRVQQYLERIRAYGATLLIGYASALHYLAATMLARGYPNPGVRGVISSAETLGADERRVIERAFGCPVLDRYGSREMGVVAQQCEQAGGLHLNTDRVHAEVLTPEGRPCAPGELGELVLTDLHNRVMTFVRYRTGDLAVATDAVCPCGRTLPLVASVAGRVSDLLVGLNGKIYSCPGPVFWTEGIPGVKQLQLYQGDRESVEARLVPGPQWNAEAARRLEHRLRDLLGPVRVAIVLKDEIPVSPSGKYRFAISEVSPFNGAPPRA